MNLNGSEIKVLKTVAKKERESIGEVVRNTKISYPHLSRILKSLSEKGILETRKRGLSKYVYFSDTKHAILLKTFLSEFGHMHLDKILSGSALVVLSPLAYSPLKKDEIISFSQLSERTVQSKLKILREFGIIIKKDKVTYEFNERFNLLREFIIEFRNYMNHKMAIEFANDAIILWQRGNEFLIKTSEFKESEEFMLTSLSAYHKFSVQLFVPEYYYYFYSPFKRDLSVEDIILHTLVLDPTDTRLILGVLLLWKKVEKINLDYMLKESTKYILQPTISALETYFSSRGKIKPDHFPTWEEFQSKAMEYGLDGAQDVYQI
ncbi:MAG: winged helix-turn-helix domain-containing protein [Candidatus Hydrothermarchaeota archaeon]